MLTPATAQRISPGAALTALLLALALSAGAPARARTAARGSGGAVATLSTPASQAALAILDRGGNAIDAAVAAAATLGVTDPLSCGIGGGGFMLIYLAKERRVVTLDHRATAPAAFAGAIPADGEALAGGMAVGVPGAVRGWHDALERYGTMSLRQVLAPAIALALKGFPVNAALQRQDAEAADKLGLFTGASALYLKDGKALPVGAVLRNPELAKAYNEIANGGPDAFYRGKIARAMVAAVAHPAARAGVKVRAGVLGLADLALYSAHFGQPLRTSYRGYDLYGMNLPSSGGVAIGEALNILEGYALGALPRAQAEHLYLEASRLALQDRDTYLGDPEYADAPVAGLLSKDYAAQRRALIDAAAAPQAHAAGAGDPYPFQEAQAKAPLPGRSRLLAENTHTTHLTLSDRDGNIVAYTFTIESGGGSGIVVPGYGFLLNNEMGEVEAGAVGRRPRSSMAPTIAFKDGRPAFTIGSPGGASIITTLVQTIVNYVDLGMTMEQAIDAPRMSAREGATEVEPGFAGSAQAGELEQLGHRWSGTGAEIGAASALVFNPDGSVTAVSETRRHGAGSALVQQPVP
jgi:gamma-glutamyltranspeptidase / glutathione hydrolase